MTHARSSLARSALVGVVATLIDLAALALLIDGLGVPAAIANVPALTLGLLVQFVGNKYFAFEDRSRAIGRQGAQFAAVEAGAFALNLLAFHALAVWLPAPPLLARVVGSAAVYFGFSYPLWRRIFQRSPDRNPARDCVVGG